MKRWSLTSALAVFICGFAFALLSGAKGAVRAQTPEEDILPAEASDTAFLTIEDAAVFDLSKWRKVHWWNSWHRVSPVDMSDTLVVKRLGDETQYVVHFATTGYAIDLDCQQIDCAVKKRGPKDTLFHKGLNEYALVADMSKVPKGGQTRIVMRGTYWNNFQEDSTAVDTYTTDDIGQMRRLMLIVRLPANRQARNVRAFWEPSGHVGGGGLYEPQGELRSLDQGRTLAWLISQRVPNRHYQISWVW